MTEMTDYICEDCGAVWEDSLDDPHDRCPDCDRKNIAFFVPATAVDTERAAP